MIFRILLLCLVGVFLTSCKNEKNQEDALNTINKENQNLSDINLVIKSTVSIDSIWIADIAQKESLFLPYKDTIKVDLKRNLNDLYTIDIYSKKEKIGTQLWLDGDNVIIDLNFDNKKLYTKAINKSPLYEASIHHTKQYNRLVSQKSDSTTIDKFMISEVRKNLDTPLSHSIASNYLNRNQNNREKVDILYRLMRMQTDSLRNHIINNNDRINKILDTEAVKFAKYDLGNLEDNKQNIVLEDSKRYLLDFWFVRCPPCIQDHKRIQKNYTIFKENNIELISISRDNNYKEWKAYLDKNNYPWLNVREQKLEVRLTYDLSIWSYPTYALIDSKGTIEKRFRSFSQFQQYINNK